MSENKNPPLSEEVEFDAVDLEKQPKRVRKAEVKPPIRKKSTPAKKTFSKDEKNIAWGTKKKLLPLPFKVAKKKPFKGRKIVKPNFKGIEKKYKLRASVMDTSQIQSFSSTTTTTTTTL